MADEWGGQGDEVEQLRRESEALLESARAVMTYRRFEEAARGVFEACRRLLGARAGFAAVADPGDPGGELLFLESDGKPCAVPQATPQEVAALLREARGSARPVLQNAVPGCPGMVCAPWGEITVENVLLAPLVADGRTEGVIGLVNKPGGFTPHDAGLASAFAEHAVLALARSRWLDALEESRGRLRESEELFRALAETSPSLLSLRDAAGRMRWNNAVSLKTLGYRPEEERAPFEVIHADDRERVKGAWAAMVAGDGEGKVGPYRCLTALGEYIYLESKARRITANGETLYLVTSRDVTELVELRRRTRTAAVEGIVGASPRMQEVFVAIRELAQADVPVLVEGESGTGKELVANAIHRLGPRAERGFVPVNCAALPEQLLESELFGHVRGAFTGAIRDKKGRFELADGGTIFLDEVAEIPPAVQVKLLRVLQEGVFERVGAERATRVGVRVISATNRNLRAEVAAGRFREDLFYRLSVVDLILPPLRERPTDIPLLVEHILAEEAGRAERRAGDGRTRRFSVSPQTLALLVAHPWPGNVRELQNAMRHAIVKAAGGLIHPEHLPRSVTAAGGAGPPRAAGTAAALPARRQRAALTADAVNEALAKSGGHRGNAAKLLGVSRATFYRFLDRGSS